MSPQFRHSWGGSSRPATAAFAGLLFAAQILLLGCGRSGESAAVPANTSSTEPTATWLAPAAESTSGRPPKITAAERRRAGRAAAFLEAGADNSVPTFGTESSPAERRRAEIVIRTFLVARAAGDWARSCSELAAANGEGLAKLGKPGKETCPQVLAALTSDSANPLAKPLAALRVKGQNAFALFLGRDGRQYVVPLLREAGAWRLTQSTPIPYPPAAP